MTSYEKMHLAGEGGELRHFKEPGVRGIPTSVLSRDGSEFQQNNNSSQSRMDLGGVLFAGRWR